jgi:hypothetical protein
MQNKHLINKISCADFLASISANIGLEESVFDYIETMASQLAMMAAGSDHQFLSHLLSLAATEAEIRKSQCQRRT